MGNLIKFVACNQFTGILDIDPLPTCPLPAWPLLAVRAVEFTAPSSWAEWGLLVTIAMLCLLLSAFVSGSEIAYFGLDKSQTEALADQSNASSRKASEMLGNSERLLATILISNNLVNITMVVLLTFAINQVASFSSTVLDFLVQTVLLTFLLLLFGEIFPKLVARTDSFKWVTRSANALYLLYRLFAAPAKAMMKSSVIVNRFVTKRDEEISTDDLEAALSISNISEGQEREMLEGILSFGEKDVSEIMISRVDVTAVEYHASWNSVIDVIRTSGYSRIPVYDTSQDTIRGILYSKDLLPYIGSRDDSFRWQSLLRKPFFVPDSRMIDDLLEDFRKLHIHIAIVIDEYGGTQGIVTLEDIIEEIIGEIDDEYDDTTSMYKKLGPDTYLFDGKISISDLCKCLGIEEEELGEAGEAETLAGLLLNVKGDFPQQREELECGPLTCTVLKLERHRITKVKVKNSSSASET